MLETSCRFEYLIKPIFLSFCVLLYFYLLVNKLACEDVDDAENEDTRSDF